MIEKVDALAKILEVPRYRLQDLDEAMKQAVKNGEVLDEVARQNEEQVRRVLGEREYGAREVREILKEKIRIHEEELYHLVGVDRDAFDFERVARAARSMATETEGVFLRWELAEEILKKRPPVRMLEFFGYEGTEELLSRQDIREVFSALRFTETNDWMHETFDVAYREFTPAHFERRPIELRVLGDQWKEIAEKYVAKKHHNVSHLKEFGIIFLNPIQQTEPGKFLRDYALLLHYFHEVSFYSKLFEAYGNREDFNDSFRSLLRGDVPEQTTAEPGEWLLVQRYLWKENPADDRLFLPRVNPEALHWMKAQKDIVKFGEEQEGSGLEFWNELWYTAGMFPGESGEEELVSFHFEDVAMSVASESDGRNETFFYHQREALWNKLFAEYVGGYEALERKLIENMDKGIIRFS